MAFSILGISVLEEASHSSSKEHKASLFNSAEIALQKLLAVNILIPRRLPDTAFLCVHTR